MRAPTVAAITLHPTGGGIAVVSDLLWRVVRSRCDSRAQLLTMFDHESRPATFAEKARFTASLTGAQAFGRADWILFTHLALAKIQKAVPERVRRPYAVFLHGIEAWNGLTAVEKEALARADMRIANSTYTAARIAEAHPDIGPIEACPLALQPSAEAPCRTERPAAYGPHMVLAVGRLSRSERYKGHDQLISAWPAVVARVPDARLVIAGAGDDADRLKETANASSAANHIEFHGYVPTDALDALYRSAAVFALPSRSEGFGLVYLEAMSHRLPCIGSIHDAARDVIADGRTGHLVDQDDIPGIADTITSLLCDPDRRRRMGEAGYARLMSEFTFDRFTDRVCALLQRRFVAAVSAV